MLIFGVAARPGLLPARVHDGHRGAHPSCTSTPHACRASAICASSAVTSCRSCARRSSSRPRSSRSSRSRSSPGWSSSGSATRRVPTWGGMLNDAFTKIYKAPILMLWPSLAIALTSIALMLLANAMRDVLERTVVGAPQAPPRGDHRAPARSPRSPRADERRRPRRRRSTSSPPDGRPIRHDDDEQAAVALVGGRPERQGSARRLPPERRLHARGRARRLAATSARARSTA